MKSSKTIKMPGKVIKKVAGKVADKVASTVAVARKADTSDKSKVYGRTFTYLGFRFAVARDFTKAERKLGVMLPLCSIGITNYTDTLNARTDEWNYEDFYAIAKSKNMICDIYFLILNVGMALVVPGQNELFAFDRAEAAKINSRSTAVGAGATAAERYDNLCVQVENELKLFADKIKDHKVRQRCTPTDWGFVGDMSHYLETLRQLTVPR